MIKSKNISNVSFFIFKNFLFFINYLLIKFVLFSMEVNIIASDFIFSYQHLCKKIEVVRQLILVRIKKNLYHYLYLILT
jgi:hypothetical protein